MARPGVASELLLKGPQHAVSIIFGGSFRINSHLSEGAKIHSANEPAEGTEIGRVTSGIPSPTLSKNIAMGCVKTGFHKKGTIVEVDVRGKKRKGVVTTMPFVPTRYWKGPGLKDS